MNSIRLICLLSACCFLAAAQGLSSVSTEHPEQIGGRWETSTRGGVEGIGLEVSSSSEGSLGSDGEHFNGQSVNIRVYTRDSGEEVWGYFAAREKAAAHLYDDILDGHSFDLFDGRRLRVHSTEVSGLKQFDLDITFLPDSNEWVGTWSRPGKTEHIVLKRPEANTSAKSSKLVGEWGGSPGPESPNSFASTILDIRQSSDGVITASLDRIYSVKDARSGVISNDRRNGEQLHIESLSDDGTLVVRTTSPAAPAFEYRGTLSPDGQFLKGSWTTLGGGGRLNVADDFRRMPFGFVPEQSAR